MLAPSLGTGAKWKAWQVAERDQVGISNFMRVVDEREAVEAWRRVGGDALNTCVSQMGDLRLP